MRETLPTVLAFAPVPKTIAQPRLRDPWILLRHQAGPRLGEQPVVQEANSPHKQRLLPGPTRARLGHSPVVNNPVYQNSNSTLTP